MIGGNTKTCMIAAISPADYNYEETLTTLRYANNAKNIKNKPRINEDPKDTMLREFKEEIDRLRQLLSEQTGLPKELLLVNKNKPAKSIEHNDTEASESENIDTNRSENNAIEIPITKKIKKIKKKPVEVVNNNENDNEIEDEEEEETEDGTEIDEMTEETKDETKVKVKKQKQKQKKVKQETQETEETQESNETIENPNSNAINNELENERNIALEKLKQKEAEIENERVLREELNLRLQELQKMVSFFVRSFVHSLFDDLTIQSLN